MIFIQLDLTDIRSRDRLLSPQARHPGIKILQSAIERLYLANTAAQLAKLDGFVKQIQAVFPYHFLDARRGREKNFDLNSVTLSNGIHAIVGLLIQPPSVQGEHSKIGSPHAVHEIDQNRLLGLKGTGEGKPRIKSWQRPRNDLRCR